MNSRGSLVGSSGEQLVVAAGDQILVEGVVVRVSGVEVGEWRFSRKAKLVVHGTAGDGEQVTRSFHPDQSEFWPLNYPGFPDGCRSGVAENATTERLAEIEAGVRS